MNEKLITPAKSLSGSQIGLAIGAGFWGGIFPIPALSTFATLGLTSVILYSMFNPAMTTIAISINLAVTPIQIALMPFFMDLPSKYTSLPSCSVSELIDSIKTKPLLHTTKTFGACMFWAVVAWAVIAPFVIFSLRFIVAAASKLGTKKKDV
jgi:hypothetical protein